MFQYDVLYFLFNSTIDKPCVLVSSSFSLRAHACVSVCLLVSGLGQEYLFGTVCFVSI